MFTGIIKALGVVHEAVPVGGDLRIAVDCNALGIEAAAIGDSIAVNGCCLTAARIEGQRFFADVSRETLAMTTLDQFAAGRPVNLEPALTAGDPLGGHMVSGHVDGVARITAIDEDARSWRFRIAPPPALMPYMARKGSVAVDGVSLTINEVGANEFGVNIVPHTLEHTVFSEYTPGSEVNIEVDVVARYIERLLEARA